MRAHSDTVVVLFAVFSALLVVWEISLDVVRLAEMRAAVKICTPTDVCGFQGIHGKDRCMLFSSSHLFPGHFTLILCGNSSSATA